MTEARDRSTLAALLADPQAPDEQIEALYLRVNGPRIYALAYERAQLEGRGVVLLDLRGRGWRGIQGNLRALFVSDAEASRNTGWPFEQIAQAVASYELATEAVVLVMYDHGLSYSILSYAPDEPS